MHEGTPQIDLSRLMPGLYSQGTEEAILSRILERIPTTNRYCVDIGASDGLRNSNTALLLREQGWSGTLVEASAYRFGRLRENYGEAKNVTLVGERVQPDMADDLLDEAGVPAVYDFLSLDIDGNDYWVWRALRRHRARIVVVEYNPYYAPPERWVMAFDATMPGMGRPITEPASSHWLRSARRSAMSWCAATTWVTTPSSSTATSTPCSASPITNRGCCSARRCTTFDTWGTTRSLPGILTGSDLASRSE